MNRKEFLKLPMDERRRILADEAKEFAERQLPKPDIVRCVECGAMGLIGFVMEKGEWSCPDCQSPLVNLRAEVSRLQAELATTDEMLQSEQLAHIETDKQLKASEQAREEAVRELEDFVKVTKSVTTRLTKAEEALRCAIAWMPDNDKRREIVAALQPEVKG